MKARKIIVGCGVTAVAAGTIISGCGTSSSSNQAGAGSKSNVSTSNSPANSTSTSSSKNVTINFMNIGANPQILSFFNKTVIPGFEKQNPNIHVVMQNVAWGQSFNKITTGVASHNAPDVFFMGGIWTDPLAAKDALLPLTKYTQNWKEKSDFNQGAWKNGQYKGVQYAIPITTDVRGVFYRSDLLKKASLTPPTTWKEYYDDAKKLTIKSGNNTKVEGADWGIGDGQGLEQSFGQLFLQAGGHYFNASGTKAEFNSPAGQAALKYLKSFYQNGISSTNFTTKGSGPSPISIGEAAMTFTNGQAITNAKQYDPKIASNIKLAPQPLSQKPGSTPVSLEFVNKVGIYKGTKYPDQSWKFVAYLAQPSVLSKWNVLSGSVPTLKSLANQAPWNSGYDKVEMSVAKDSVGQPGSPAMFQIVNILTTTLNDWVVGKLTNDQCLKQLDTKIDAALASQ